MARQVKIGVIGGGAAGMTAAITAAREGADVTILEAGDRLGQKILSTGNGKCNLGNLELSPSRYYNRGGDLLSSCLEEFGTEDTIRFFRSIGLLVKEKNGYLYPLSEQASTVLDVLRNEVSALKIKVCYQFRVQEIRPDKKGFLVKSANGREFFDRVILTCGGKAMPKTGSDGSGYQLAKSLGHEIVPVVPGLTNLKCEGDFFKGLSGVRTKAELILLDRGGNEIAREQGELQLTDYGLSGIPVFQLCRNAAYLLLKGEKPTVCIDFLPEHSMQDLKTILEERMSLAKNRTVDEYFTGILNKKIMTFLIRKAGLKGTEKASFYSGGDLFRVFSIAKALQVKVLATGDFSSCQVCAGGVSLRQVGKGMESGILPGLFFAGEILDVDGMCGGYNLQWAWSSASIAGKNAAKPMQ